MQATRKPKHRITHIELVKSPMGGGRWLKARLSCGHLTLGPALNECAGYMFFGTVTQCSECTSGRDV